MELFDISRELKVGTAVWPGDTPFQINQMMDRSKGDTVNLTTLTLSAHTGTHVDAPLHFTDEKQAIDDLDLVPFWGPAQVATVKKKNGPLFPADLSHVDLSLAERLLVRSASSELAQELFPDGFVYPSPELAEHLGHMDLVLYGTDAPSMDAEKSPILNGHLALRRNRIAILEWLDLSSVPDGLYELVALPLRIANGDGSPVRAVLRR